MGICFGIGKARFKSHKERKKERLDVNGLGGLMKSEWGFKKSDTHPGEKVDSVALRSSCSYIAELK